MVVASWLTTPPKRNASNAAQQQQWQMAHAARADEHEGKLAGQRRVPGTTVNVGAVQFGVVRLSNVNNTPIGNARHNRTSSQ